METQERLFVYCVLTQANRLKQVVEVLKEFLTDVYMTFDKDGIKIATIDAKHVALINLRLYASAFEEYVCYEEKEVGISLPQLYKNLRSMSSGSTLRMEVAEENGYKVLRLARVTRNIIETKTKMISRGLEDEEFSLEPYPYNITIKLNSDDLQYVCKEMSNSVEDTVTITILERAIRFNAKSKIGLQEGEMTLPLSVAPVEAAEDQAAEPEEGSKKRKMETSSSSSSSSNKTRKSKVTDDVKDFGKVIVKIEYLMKYLRDFSKAAPLSTSVILQIDKRYPLMLTYKVSDMGELKLALSPTADNEDPASPSPEEGDD